MAKVLSVMEKTSQQGKKYYIAMAEGMDKQILSFNFIKLGDDINPDNLELNDKGDTWKFKSGSDGRAWQDRKQGAQRNDDLIVSQVAFKAMVDLVVAGKMEVKAMSADHCISLAQMIKKTAQVIKETPAEPQKTVTAASPQEINLDEVLACDWSTFEKKDFDHALAGVAKAKKFSAESAKAFLIDKFGIESSSMIPIARRNEVIKAMAC